MSKRVTTEIFIERSKLIHGDKYDYSLVNYVKSNIKVNIICKKHGVFEQNPCSHLKGIGCKFCGYIKSSKNNTKTNNYFINKSNQIHLNKYDYSLVNYVNTQIKVKIICPKHGVFKQKPSNHLRKIGCHECGREKIKKYNKENPVGWNITNWDNASKKSKYFDSFKVYIIKCWNDEEEFYKIGRTYQKINKRFKSFIYNYEVLREFVLDTAKEAFNKEVELKRIHKKHRYLPNISFNGKNECFSKINLDII